MSVINVFTSYYQCGDQSRQVEIDLCLKKNIANPLIEKLIVMVDDGSKLPYQDEKIEVLHIEDRPTYGLWLQLTRDMGLAGYSLLCNSDIYFDHSLALLDKVLEEPKTIMALSRWDMIGSTSTLHPNPHWSQDVWAVNCADEIDAPIWKLLDIPLGVPRCDNKIAYIFGIYGWKIANPCKHLKSYHVHETGYRTYNKTLDDRIIGGVAYVYPGKNLQDAAKIDIDIWAKGTRAIKKVALNKSLDNWIAEAQQSLPEGGLPTGSNSSKDKKLKANGVGAALAKNPTPRSKCKTTKFILEGALLYDHLSRFRIYQQNNTHLYWDGLYPGNPLFHDQNLSGRISCDRLDAKQLSMWISPVIDMSPLQIKDRPASRDDCLFWQYPCATEKQACDNHKMILRGENIDQKRKIIHTFLPLPWATFIDKDGFPDEITSLFRPRISGLKSLAAASGYELRVHTVCQQIHWRKIINNFNSLGVTDLHLSHCEKQMNSQGEEVQFRIHSWPLIAVNVENPSRSKGVVFGKPASDKKYLASFIGAHMSHYRSDVRLKLLDAVKSDGRHDILFELGGEWHFDKIVYQEQVKHEPLDQTDLSRHEKDTTRYNEILSDSVFSLCPEGAGPNTLRVWESIAVGAIPVILSDDWIPPDMHTSSLCMEDFCVIVRRSEIDGLFERLRAMDHEKIKQMQTASMQAYQHFKKLRTYNNKTEVKASLSFGEKYE